MNTDHIFSTPEMQTSKVYINPSTGTQHQIYRRIVDLGALPNITTKNVPHGISGLAIGRYIDVRVSANNSVKSSNAPAGLTVEVDATNITLISTTNLSTFNGVAIVEYTKG